MTTATQIDIIVPAYKNPILLKDCVESLLHNIGEIANYSPRIIILNDSPDDSGVCDYLCDLQKNITPEYKSTENILIYTNEENLGFVKTVNLGLALTVKEKRSAILINADTVTFPGTLKNLIDAAYSDPQVGVACPRSNNASFATFPHFPHPLSGISTSPTAAYSIWKILAEQLPELTYSPTAIGFYLLIKEKVLATFPKLDEIFGKGYEEENDFILRANKVGYLSVLANHSFAFHYGSASFKLVTETLESDKEKNLHIMSERNPEFLPLVREFENSPAFVAERLLSNLLSAKGKYDIVFDLRRLWLAHNGTTIGTTTLLKAICNAGASRFNFYALCSEDAFKFHGLDDIENLNLTLNIESKYAVAVNMGQPFDLDQINVLEKLAPLNVYGMLDIIALDCGYLRVQNNFSLDRYWPHVFMHADGIFYNSEFSCDTFRRRFSSFLLGNPDQVHAALLMPTEMRAYIQTERSAPGGQRHVMVMGNHFKHKGAAEAAKAISAKFGSLKIICLANENRTDGNIQYVKSGEVPDHVMASHFSNASLVVLPSFYEGFGIGLVDALSNALPVAVRNIPPVVEILATYDNYSGVYTYDTDDELCDLISKYSGKTSHANGGITSAQWGVSFCDFISNVINKNNKYKNICERLISTRSLNEYSQLYTILDSQKQQPEFHPTQKQVSGLKSALHNLFNMESNDHFVHGIFNLVLGRAVDQNGLNHYLNQLNNNKQNRFQVLTDILSSPEMGIFNKSDKKSSRKYFHSIFKH